MTLHHGRQRILLISALLFERTHAFQSQTTTPLFASPATTRRYPHSSSSLKSSFLNEKDPSFRRQVTAPKRGDREKLSAVVTADYSNLDSSGSYTLQGGRGGLHRSMDNTVPDPIAVPWEELLDGIKPVLAASLLITGNTIGAGCLVMPEICAGPGLAVSSGVMVACFVTNLISGLVIAEVAIKQYEASSTQEAPSSFKELAKANFNSDLAANGVGALCIFVNACVMTFNLARIGDVLAAGFSATVATATATADPSSIATIMMEHPSLVGSVGYASLLVLAASTLSSKQLGNLAGCAVTGLFVTLTAILIPGLATIHDPSAVFFSPGTADHVWDAAGRVAPILLSAFTYQNIVPSVTKLLHYNRSQIIAALFLGSFLPSMIYFMYSYVVMGGGGITEQAASGSSGSLLMTVFSITTIVGSSIACVMSMSEELEGFLNPKLSQGDESTNIQEEMVGSLPKILVTSSNNNTKKEEDSRKDTFSISTVLIAVGVPLSIGIACSGGEDLTAALRMAGSYGAPLLYGALPAAMAWNQRQKLSDGLRDTLPGGMLSLGGLASTTAVFMLEELTKDVSGLFG